MAPARLTTSEIDAQLQTLYLTSSASDLSSQTASDHGLTAGLGPILKSILATRQETAYVNQLRQFIKQKDAEIEEICKENATEFIGSTDKLSKVRQGTISLKNRVAELNQDVQTKGNQLAAQKRILLDHKRVANNIDETIETCTACLRVLDLYSKVEGLIQEQKYYSALRTLDQLAKDGIKTVQTISAPFANSILSTLPATRQTIKEASLKELKTWFFEAREKSQSIGQKAMQQMDVRVRRWKARKARDTLLRTSHVNSAVELVMAERHEYNVFADQDVLDSDAPSQPGQIDFKPLYNCVLIHDLLNAREELQATYLEDRRAQASLLSSGSLNNTSSFTLAGLTTVLEELAGFFLIEQFVQTHTPAGFRPERDTLGLWHATIEKTLASISDSISRCQQVEDVLESKMLFDLFVLTMSSVGYDMSLLTQFLDTLCDRFVHMLEVKSSNELESIVEEDEHFQMMVNDVEDFEKVASVSWLPLEGPWSEQGLKQQTFPLALPFSQTYPLCCIDIRNFVDQFYQFFEHDSVSKRSTMELTAKKILDRMLTERISLRMRYQVDRMSNLTQLALIVVNLFFFETACCELEILLGSLRNTNDPTPAQLDSVQSFRETLTITQDRINALIISKIDAFFDLCDYDWTSQANSEQEPSEYVVEMMGYLNLLVESALITLPDVLRKAIYKEALQHCQDRLMSFLVHQEPDQMSEGGLATLAVDVRYISQHVTDIATLSAEDEEQHRLDLVFEELSQMIALLQSDTMTEFLDNDIRELAFSRVQADKLQNSLVKLLTWYDAQGQSQNAGSKRKRDLEQVLEAMLQPSA